MINLTEIDNTINELLQGNTTFNSCEKLASLYIVKDHLKEPEFEANNNEYQGVMTMTPMPEMDTELVTKEYHDILPDYKYYCDVKKKYQLGEVSEQKVLNAMKDTVKELKEFIYTLYNSTDMPEERYIISEMIQNVQF